MAYLSVEAGGGNPKSGQAMETYVPPSVRGEADE
jgi:hypothetical protein